MNQHKIIKTISGMFILHVVEINCDIQSNAQYTKYNIQIKLK